MFKAKIENGKETQYLELPCDQETLMKIPMTVNHLHGEFRPA